MKHMMTLFLRLFRFVIYFSALCHDANEGKRLLHAAMDALLTVPEAGHPESGTTVQSEVAAEVKPSIVWKALYIQELAMVCFFSQLVNF